MDSPSKLRFSPDKKTRNGPRQFGVPDSIFEEKEYMNDI
jgi:hypothetical protein